MTNNDLPRDSKGRFLKGLHYNPDIEFKPGQHWRVPQVFRDKKWLENEYIVKGRSLNEIGEEFGVSAPAIKFWMKKHNIPRRSVSESRAIKHWGLSGEANGMYGKTGENSSNWKGGRTPERQEFYASKEWRDVSRAVKIRDQLKCVRCGDAAKGHKLHIHHIVSFYVRELRADINNLVLLCLVCHKWVHSKANINNDYIDSQGR